MVRAMAGHAPRTHTRPATLLPTSSLPSLSRSTTSTPKKGSVAEPGFVGVAPGSGVMMCPPVSVCQNVSTTAQRPPPTTEWYHRHASGLMGSPTDPNTRRELKSCLRTGASPKRMSARMAVGAV